MLSFKKCPSRVLLPGPSPRPPDRPGGGPRPAAHAAAARAFLQPGPCGRPSRPGAFAKVLPLLGTFYHSGLSPSGTPGALHHPRCAESLPSQAEVPTGSAPGLYGSPPQTEPQPASGGCARYSGSSRHRASHGPRGSEGRLQSSLLAAWKVLEMGPTSRARMLPHQGGPGSRGAGLTLARRARRCPGATRGAG